MSKEDKKSEGKYFILYKFATRSRPDKFISGIENIVNLSSDKNNFKILVSADIDDATMYNKDVLNRIYNHIKSGLVEIHYGNSKSKIDAINRDMDKAGEWDILVNFSDDMQFIKNGFDETIRNDFKINFPDLSGNLHYNDGFQKDRISTMSIFGKGWYDRFKYIYHPDYKSLFCDEEYTYVARKLNKMVYIQDIIFNHNHPANVGGMVDEQLRKTESFWDEDRNTFERRSKNNFDLN